MRRADDWEREPDTVPMSQLVGLLQRYPFKPYREFNLASDLELAEYVLDLLRADSNRLLIATVKGAIVGCAFWRHLDWDSSIFDIKMARLSLVAVKEGFEHFVPNLVAEVLEDCRTAQVRHIAFRGDMADIVTIHGLEANGFYLVDTLSSLYAKGTTDLPTERVRNYEPTDLPTMLSIGRSAFERSRFNSDPFLPKDRVQEVYPQWIRTACAGRAGFTGVAQVDGQVAGFIICSVNRSKIGDRVLRLGVIELIAVDPLFAGLGLGSELVGAGRNWLGVNSDLYTVGTRSDNFAALAIYLKQGFKLYSGKVGFHRWMALK